MAAAAEVAAAAELVPDNRAAACDIVKIAIGKAWLFLSCGS